MTADVVRLVGGPMDGWLVKPDALALERDWAKGQRKAYVLGEPGEDGVPEARWYHLVDVRTYGDDGPRYIVGEPVGEPVD